MNICCVEECGAHSVRPMLVPSCEVEAVEYYPCLPACSQPMYCCVKPKPKHHRDHEPNRSESHLGRHSHHKTERRPSSPPNNHQDRPGSSPNKHQDCCYIRPASPRPSCCEPQCKPVKTKYVIPCYRYEDGRIVRKLPVTAFKRNGMQDQEHGKLQGATNFLRRCGRDVELDCDVCPNHTNIKVCDIAKVPVCDGKPVRCKIMKKKPIKANQLTVLMRRACEVAVGNRPRKKPYEETRILQDANHRESRYIREDEEGNCCFHFENQKTCCTRHPEPIGSCASCPQYCMEYPPCVTARPQRDNDCYYCRPC